MTRDGYCVELDGTSSSLMIKPCNILPTVCVVWLYVACCFHMCTCSCCPEDSQEFFSFEIRSSSVCAEEAEGLVRGEYLARPLVSFAPIFPFLCFACCPCSGVFQMTMRTFHLSGAKAWHDLHCQL
jgi:hypothetical protein